MTTVPSRFNSTLPITLKSLADGGFDKPRLFIDGECTIPSELRHYEITHHVPRLRAFGNWVTALWELYIREPTADRYAIFQDDFVTYRNLREYLTKSPYPDKGYLNLYTFPENDDHNKTKQEGWFLSNQYGRGAVALVFNRDAVTTLLAQQSFVNRPMSARRGWKCIDGGIVDAMKSAGFKEYVHNPSLVQHIGDISTLENPQHQKARTFLGEEFDARLLLTKPKNAPSIVKKLTSERIGLVGHNCASGLGTLNWQIATYAEVDRWLVRAHAHYPTLEDHPDVDTMHCPSGKKIVQFLNKIDTVLFCEVPVYNNFLDVCKQSGKRVVCVPMLEWLPEVGRPSWADLVDLFICPTQHCYDTLKDEGRPCVFFPWPVDVDRFEFRQRNKVENFLFLNGHGGWKGRKGAEVVRQSKQLWPEMPLIVSSQVAEGWPPGTIVIPPTKTPQELYQKGDVLLMPHSVDGLGLSAFEGIASGLPLIRTEGEHWQDIPSLAQIDATRDSRRVGRQINWYSPTPQGLVSVCQSVLQLDLGVASQNGRLWAESRSWSKLADKFTHLVRYGALD